MKTMADILDALADRFGRQCLFDSGTKKYVDDIAGDDLPARERRLLKAAFESGAMGKYRMPADYDEVLSDLGEYTCWDSGTLRIVMNAFAEVLSFGTPESGGGRNFGDSVISVSGAVGDGLTMYESECMAKAERLFYDEGKYDEAVSLLAPVYEGHRENAAVHELYFPMLVSVDSRGAGALPADAAGLGACLARVKAAFLRSDLQLAEREFAKIDAVWRDDARFVYFRMVMLFMFYAEFSSERYYDEALALYDAFGETESKLERTLRRKAFILINMVNTTGNGVYYRLTPDYCHKRGIYYDLVNETSMLDFLKKIVDRSEADYDKAAKWYEVQAGKVDANALCWMGVMRYYSARNGCRDYGDAFRIFSRAAELGDPEAMGWIADFYRDGNFVSQDFAKAFEWFSRGAAAGDFGSIVGTGNAYYSGKGVPQDYAEAAKWYGASAKSGNSHAADWFAFCHYKGYGVPQDDSQAFRWWKKGSDLGNANCMNWVGVCYRDGIGAEENHNEAKKWFRKAKENGYEKS